MTAIQAATATTSSFKAVIRCSSCGEEKPAEAFSLRKGSATGRQGYCRACFAARWKQTSRTRRRMYYRQSNAARREAKRKPPCATSETLASSTMCMHGALTSRRCRAKATWRSTKSPWKACSRHKLDSDVPIYRAVPKVTSSPGLTAQPAGPRPVCTTACIDT